MQGLCFKYRCCYCSGVARPTDQEATAIKTKVCNSQIPRARGMPSHMGKYQGRQEADGDGELRARAFIVVSTVKERNGPGRVSRLVWVISAGFGAWGLPLVVWHLALGWAGRG